MKFVQDSEGLSGKDFLLRRLVWALEEERLPIALRHALTLSKMVVNQDSWEYFNALVSDLPFMRSLALLDAIKSNPETALEYYDKDRDQDPYPYDEETEGRLLAVRSRLGDFLAEYLYEEGVDLGAVLEGL